MIRIGVDVGGTGIQIGVFETSAIRARERKIAVSVTIIDRGWPV